MVQIGRALFGSKPRIQERQIYQPGQQALLDQIMGGLQGQNQQQAGPIGQGMSNLQQLLSGDTEAFEAPAMRQFQEQILPQLATQFGGLGAQSSSGYAQALSSAGAGLAERLAQMRAGLQQDALGQLQPFMAQALAPRTQAFQTGGTQGFLPGLLGGAAQSPFGGAMQNRLMYGMGLAPFSQGGRMGMM